MSGPERVEWRELHSSLTYLRAMQVQLVDEGSWEAKSLIAPHQGSSWAGPQEREETSVMANPFAIWVLTIADMAVEAWIWMTIVKTRLNCKACSMPE